MLLCFANGELYFVLPPEQNQHGAQGMGKKSIYYGSVSSLSFRFFVFAHSVLFRFLFFDAGVMIYPANVVKPLNVRIFRAVICKQHRKNCQKYNF